MPTLLHTSRPVRELPWFVFLLVVSMLVYWPCISGGFVWDENAVQKNPLLSSPEGLWSIWTHPRLNRYEAHYWPLTYTVFWLEYQVWGLATTGYHIVNIALHAGAAYMLGILLKQLRVEAWAFAVLLFVVHPVHVESVAWIIELKDVLSALLGFSCVVCFLRWDATPDRRSWYVASLLLFALALLSKSVVVTLPVCLAALLWWRSRRLSRVQQVSLLPFVILAVVFALADTQFAKANESVTDPLSLRTRLSIPGYAIWLYLLKIFLPLRLSPLYPRWDHGVTKSILLLTVYFVSLIGAVWKGWRGTATAFLLFLVLLLPMLGFVPFAYLRHAYIADRFAYLASASVLAWIAAGIQMLSSIARVSVMRAMQAALIGCLGAATLWQSSIWSSEDRFWSVVASGNPGSSLAHANLGLALMRAHQPSAALAEFDRSLQLDPQNATGYLNRGVILEQAGRIGEAEQQYRLALKHKPDYAEAYYNLGRLQLQRGQTVDAQASLEMAVRINPLYANAKQLLARLQQQNR